MFGEVEVRGKAGDAAAGDDDFHFFGFGRFVFLFSIMLAT